MTKTRSYLVSAWLLRHRATVSLLCAFASTSILNGATRVGYNGWENGFGEWRQDGTRDVPEIVSSGALAGTKCLSMNWNGTVEWNAHNRFQTLKLPWFPYTNEVFTRAYFKVAADVDNPPDGTGPKFFKWGAGTLKEIYHSLLMDGVRLFEAPNSPDGGLTKRMSSFWGSENGSLYPRETWVKIEHYMSGDLIRLWVDDVLCKEWKIDTNVGGTWFPLILGSNWSGGGMVNGRVHDQNNHIFVDEIEIYTDAESGTPTFGSMREGTITVEEGSAGAPEIKSVNLENGVLTIRWQDAPGVKLQGCTDLSGANWTEIPSSNGSAEIRASDAAKFFRLAQ
jgi:hypothetical protein